MPVRLLNHECSIYTSALALPSAVWDAFGANPHDANVIYPHALKSLARERLEGQTNHGQVWISLASRFNGAVSVDFVLSCTEGPLGTYPIFIFSTQQLTRTDFQFVVTSMTYLARALYTVVSASRVFSIFAHTRISTIFADVWSALTGVARIAEPYYAATLTHCTRRSFAAHLRQPVSEPASLPHELRLATITDIPDAAALCFEFAATSAPFVLSRARARQEAALLVYAQQLWVLRMGPGGALACIVAVTRACADVAAITKVYTAPKWRGRHCAERLVRGVCRQLLKMHKSVVLYVAHDNPVAAKVYARVGFVGLLGEEFEHERGVSDWVEVGFARNKVELGHW